MPSDNGHGRINSPCHFLLDFCCLFFLVNSLLNFRLMTDIPKPKVVYFSSLSIHSSLHSFPCPFFLSLRSTSTGFVLLFFLHWNVAFGHTYYYCIARSMTRDPLPEKGRRWRDGQRATPDLTTDIIRDGHCGVCEADITAFTRRALSERSVVRGGHDIWDGRTLHSGHGTDIIRKGHDLRRA